LSVDCSIVSTIPVGEQIAPKSDFEAGQIDEETEKKYYY
jgi:hypothetical protein